ncbi:MAG: type II secretion system protein GspG [Planctomycetota bacterium]|nr:type II secretion system protein GspG [Planctomycetota bacterium]
MECTTSTDDKLCAYLFESLENGEMAAIRKHLAECDRCRKRLDAIRKRMSFLDAWRAIEPPEEFSAKVFERVKRQRRTARALFFAAGALFLFFSGFLIFLAHNMAIDRLAKRRLVLLDKAIQCSRNEHGTYPASLDEAWRFILACPAAKHYLDLGKFEVDASERILDFWGNPYVYVCPGVHNRGLFDLYSTGSNGRNDKGQQDDILNWERD